MLELVPSFKKVRLTIIILIKLPLQICTPNPPLKRIKLLNALLNNFLLIIIRRKSIS